MVFVRTVKAWLVRSRTPVVKIGLGELISPSVNGGSLPSGGDYASARWAFVGEVGGRLGVWWACAISRQHPAFHLVLDLARCWWW